jgi:hypothetical protein
MARRTPSSFVAVLAVLPLHCCGATVWPAEVIRYAIAPGVFVCATSLRMLGGAGYSVA